MCLVRILFVSSLWLSFTLYCSLLAPRKIYCILHRWVRLSGSPLFLLTFHRSLTQTGKCILNISPPALGRNLSSSPQPLEYGYVGIEIAFLWGLHNYSVSGTSLLHHFCDLKIRLVFLIWDFRMIFHLLAIVTTWWCWWGGILLNACAPAYVLGSKYSLGLLRFTLDCASISTS